MNLIYLNTPDSGTWSNGVYIFLTILAIIVTIALSLFMAWRFLKERERVIQEKRSFVEGVLNKNEMIATINSFISKNTFETPFSVALVDIDNFTQLTNAFGEKVSNDVIKTLVNRFSKLVPFHVQIGRIDSDKFLFMFGTEYNINSIYDIMENIRKEIKEPIRVSYETELNCSASLAIVTYPLHGKNAAKMIESLSIAIYTIKRDGGDRTILYSNEIAESEKENLQYYEEVTRGIKNKEFVLYYQPIIDVDSKKVVSAEALLRWEHSRLGLINPKDFIHILEQSGDIYWIGIWGLEQLIEQYNIIKKTYPSEQFTLSINLSPKQLINEKIVVDFQKILKKYHMTSKDLIIELEEFLMFDKHEIIRKNIFKLKELGFKLAIDGFAIDHNTLMKVEKLPIDYIKIDANFYDNDTSEIAKDLTEILFDFAKTRGIVIIAERIETLEQVNYFKEHNVVLNQGYLFSKPISSNELVEKIGNNGFIINALNNHKEEVFETVENTEEVDSEIKEEISEELNNLNSDLNDSEKTDESDDSSDDNK